MLMHLNFGHVSLLQEKFQLSKFFLNRTFDTGRTHVGLCPPNFYSFFVSVGSSPMKAQGSTKPSYATGHVSDYSLQHNVCLSDCLSDGSKSVFVAARLIVYAELTRTDVKIAFIESNRINRETDRQTDRILTTVVSSRLLRFSSLSYSTPDRKGTCEL